MDAWWKNPSAPESESSPCDAANWTILEVWKNRLLVSWTSGSAAGDWLSQIDWKDPNVKGWTRQYFACHTSERDSVQSSPSCCSTTRTPTPCLCRHLKVEGKENMSQSSAKSTKRQCFRWSDKLTRPENQGTALTVHRKVSQLHRTWSSDG